MNTDQTREQLAKIIHGSADPYNLTRGAQAETAADTILDKCVVEFRANLPEVAEEGGVLRVDGATYLANFATPAEHRRRARQYLALAEYLEAKEAWKAEQELATRRDELAAELYRQGGFGGHGGLNGYADLNPVTKAAVNMLIEAQDKLAKYEEVQA